MNDKDMLYRIAKLLQFDYGSDAITWRTFSEHEVEWWEKKYGKTYETDRLYFYATCSDFFYWGTADGEPIETEEDIELLERCFAELKEVENDKFPMWTTELYAARRRNQAPASFMLSGRDAMPAAVAALFPSAAAAEHGTIELTTA